MRHSVFLSTLFNAYRTIHLTLITLFLSITVLAACGKKGDLFLPVEPAPKQAKVTEQATPQTATPIDLGVPNNSGASDSTPVSQPESPDDSESKPKSSGQ